MKKRRIAWILALSGLLLIATVSFLQIDRTLRKAFASSESSQTETETAPYAAQSTPPVATTLRDQPTQKDVVINAYQTPISFWGKVIDEKGNPVSDAEVGFMAIDKPMSDRGANYKSKSDSSGLFSITEIKGAGLYVKVSKDGYHDIQSDYVIGYAIPTEQKQPSPSDPSVFILRKMGQAEPLKTYSSNGILVAKTGQPVAISLMQERVVPIEQGDLKIEVWTEDQQKDVEGRYPWKCRISAPGGGLVETKDDFSFLAPIEGYKPVVEVNMDPNSSRWRKDFEDQYFVKLKDGHFARVNLRITTGGRHFFSFTSYLNPISGSRNLEYDPPHATQ